MSKPDVSRADARRPRAGYSRSTMIDLYVYTTPNGFKALIGLEEFGLPYRTNWIDITKGAQMKPEYLAINPNNKIPALVDSDGPHGKPITVLLHQTCSREIARGHRTLHQGSRAPDARTR